MDIADLTVSNFMKNSISKKRVNGYKALFDPYNVFTWKIWQVFVLFNIFVKLS